MAVSARTRLLVLQVAGGLTLLVYPGILTAVLMTLAAPGDAGANGATFAWRALLLAAFAYPLVWGALWLLSWRAFHAGRERRAVALSAPPAAALLLGVALSLVFDGGSASLLRGFAETRTREAEHAAVQNPLAGAILSFEAGDRSLDALETAIAQAPAEQLSRPIERAPLEIPGMEIRTLANAPVKRSSPLALALEASQLDRNLNAPPPKPEFMDIARALIARSARLTDDEIARNARLVWMAQVAEHGTELPDATVAAENPLVAQIMEVAAGDSGQIAMAIVDAGRNTPALLHRATSTYGTPLRAALMRGLTDRVGDLVYNGAVLSDSERLVPSLVYEIEQFLSVPGREAFRARYTASLQRSANLPR